MNRSEKTETILYGGAFNPPTLAHMAILQACIDYARPRGAEVWLMPSGDRSDKSINASRSQRMAYLAAMLADVDSSGVATHILTTELDRSVQVETYDTVRELEALYPERHMTWVFGADSTETMGEWGHGQWLLDNLDMLVVDRQGYEINPRARRAIKLGVKTMVVSSTEVRQRLHDGRPVDDLVSRGVAQLLA